MAFRRCISPGAASVKNFDFHLKLDSDGFEPQGISDHAHGR